MKNILSILVLGLFLISTSLLSQSHIWTGNGTGGNWDDVNNWDVGTIPDITSDVSIPGGFGVIIENTTASANSIEISGDSGLSVFFDLNIVSELSITPLASMRFFNGTIAGGGVIENLGTIELLGPDQKEFSNVVINNHSIFWVQLSNQIHITNNTVINNHISGELLIASVGGFLNQGTQATLNNEGLIRKLQDGVNPFGNYYLILDINNSGIIQVDEDETFLILGGNINLNNTETGIIQGNGIYDITANFTNTGTFAPGNTSISTLGSLDIVNNFSFPQDATLDVDITGTNTGEFDLMNITGFPILEGNIDVILDYAPDINDEYMIIIANDITSCDLPQYTTAIYMGTEYTFEIICNSDNVVLKVVDQILGLNDILQKNEIFIQPNPVREEAQILFPNYNNISFSSETPNIIIYNSLGQLLKQLPIESEITLLDATYFQSGYYFLRLMDGNNVISTSKFIIE